MKSSKSLLVLLSALPAFTVGFTISPQISAPSYYSSSSLKSRRQKLSSSYASSRTDLASHHQQLLLLAETTSKTLPPIASLFLERAESTWHMYEHALQANPITTKAITSGVLATCGDAIAQYMAANNKQENKFEYDFIRGIVFLGFGSLYTGLFQHYWFNYLSNNVCAWGEQLKIWGPLQVHDIPVNSVYFLKDGWWTYFDIIHTIETPPSPTSIASAKLLVNQFLMVPSVYMPLFLGLTGCLAKLSLQENLDRSQEMYFKLLQRNYFFWLPMQFIQFLFIPQEWQILYISLASLVWTIILSSIATEQQSQQQQLSEASSIATTSTILDVTDEVSLQDVEQALVPQAARSLMEDDKFQKTTAGGFLGLLLASANDGALGGFIVDNFVGATIGSGVAIFTAAGALIGLLLTLSQTTTATKADSDQQQQQQQESIPVANTPQQIIDPSINAVLDTSSTSS